MPAQLGAGADVPTAPAARRATGEAVSAREALGRLPAAVTRVDLPLPRVRSGKVREVFAAGDGLLLVATDRISAFDCVFRSGIPGKGAVLNGISRFWLEGLGGGRHGLPAIDNHLLDGDGARVARALGLDADAARLLEGRAMLVRRADPIPVECVVRGYLEGSALKDYLETGFVAGERLPPDLRRASRLHRPLFTPARKAVAGHDENVAFDEVVRLVGGALAETLRDLSLRLYAAGAAALESRGLVLADTKFEFGIEGGGGGEGERRGRLLLIDEVLTPDSSRLWEAAAWEPGRAQASFDKQPLRDYLEDLSARGLWDKLPPAPELPDEVVVETARRYAEALRRVTCETVP